MSLRDFVKSDFLKKFVDFEEEGSRSAKGEVRSSARSSSTPLPSPPAPPPTSPTSDFDVSDIYRQMGISPAPFTAEQARELLDRLPEELTFDLKRQVASQVLRAKTATLSMPPTAVVEDARRKVDALNGAVERISGQVADFISTTEDEITHLQEEIQEKHKAIEEAQVQEQQLIQVCRLEAERLRAVLEFFG